MYNSNASKTFVTDHDGQAYRRFAFCYAYWYAKLVQARS